MYIFIYILNFNHTFKELNEERGNEEKVKTAPVGLREVIENQIVKTI